MITIKQARWRAPVIYGLVFILALLGAALLTAKLTQTSGAASGKDFNPGRIIDDVVFYNSTAMDTAQVQQFLNSKVPTCDTNGQQLSEFGGPDLNGDGKVQRWEWGQSNYGQSVFTCLKDYSQNTPGMAAASGLCGSITSGTKTAAQIINDVAKACNINPQVLLVLLNKEQSLVTDTWPLKQQYDGATGFDCPDTAPCDPNYAGFFYQVYYAARQFQIYKTQPNSFNYVAGRNNNIYWNPDLSRCGSSTVFIQNQATAALYIYTPYQPNQAALDNLYGLGDSCSAYGNRNFWRMFTDWFGPTYGTKIIKSEANPTIYVYSQGKKTPIPNLDLFNAYGFDKIGVTIVTQAYLDSLENTNPLSHLSRYSNGTIQLIDNGNRYTVTSLDQCTAWKLSCSDPYVVNTLDDDVFSSTKWLGALQPLMHHNGSIYKLEDGNKLPFLNLDAVMQNGYNYGHISAITSSINTSQPLGQIIPSNNTSFKLKTGEIIVYANNQYIKVGNLQTFYRWGLDKQYYPTLPPSSWDTTPPTPTSTLADGYVTNGDKKYLIDKGRKIDITAASTSWPAAPASTDYTSPLLAKLPSVTIGSQTCFRTTTGNILIVENNQRRNIQLLEDVHLLGCSSQPIVAVDDASLSILTHGPAKLSANRLFTKKGTSGIYMESSGNQSYHIVNTDYLSAFGETADEIAHVDDLTLSHYAVAGNASSVAGNSHLAAYFTYTPEGGRYYFTDETFSKWGFNKSLIPTYDKKIGDKNQVKAMTLFARMPNGKIYYGDNGKARLVTSYEAFYKLGGSPSNTVNVLDDFTNYLSIGSDIN